MFDRQFSNDGTGLFSLMLAIFGGLIVLLFKGGILTCEVSGRITKWGVAQFKERTQKR